MNICCISDTHGSTPDNIPSNCDILTISGDISPALRGYEGEINQSKYFWDNFVPYFSRKAKHVVFVAGNHDLFLFREMTRNSEGEFRTLLPSNMHYLRDSGVEIEGIKFWGTPWTPTFGNWSFMAGDTDGQIGEHFAKIPTGIDILLSHGPMFGHNDRIEQPIYKSQTGKFGLGSKALLHHVRRSCPRKVVVGHIHSGSHEMSYVSNNGLINEYTMSVNVSVLDEAYKPFYCAFDLRGI